MTLEYLLSVPSKLSEADKDNLILELLDQVTQLTNALQNSEGFGKEEFIAMCSYCKSIRNESGQWLSVEKYIEQRLNQSCSHGVCDSCKTDVLAKVSGAKN